MRTLCIFKTGERLSEAVYCEKSAKSHNTRVIVLRSLSTADSNSSALPRATVKREVIPNS